MPDAPTDQTLEALLDSWNRNNTILVNLLRTMPENHLDASALEGSPSIAVQFSHVQGTRLYFLSKIAPEFATDQTPLFRQEGEQRVAERDRERIAQGLNDSARAVGQAVRARIADGQPMKSENVSYDHPVLFLQHMIWHEGYHFGQIKLALKAAGYVMNEEDEERLVWNLWRREEW